jgi:F0F1-type ATP synthase assembly protein I
MFDLETEIVEWRKQMLSAGIKSPVPLDELEGHLREEIERQVKSGGNDEAAFKNALEKIGAARALKVEFAKVEKARRSAKQAKFMLTFSLMTIVALGVFIGALLFFRVGDFSELTPRQQFSGYEALTLGLLFSFGGRFGCKWFPSIRRKKVRDTICVSAGVLLALWWTLLFWGILPRHEYTIAQLCVVLLWGFVMPFGLMLGLCAAVETTARKSVSANS